MNLLLAWFLKITSWPVQLIYFHKKIYYENNDKKLKKINGPAIIVSNHKSIYDYPLIMYTFFRKNVFTLVADITFYRNKALKNLLKIFGCIPVDRENFNFNFLTSFSNNLKKGFVGIIFPEARLHNSNEDFNKLLDFKPSYVHLSLENNVPIIPVYTNGVYGKLKKKYKNRAKIIIGKPIFASSLFNEKKSYDENIKFINKYIKNCVEKLGKKLEMEK